MAHARLVTQLVEVNKRTAGLSVRRQGAPQWAQLTARQPGGSGRLAVTLEDRAQDRLQHACCTEVAVYPECDDGNGTLLMLETRPSRCTN